MGIYQRGGVWWIDYRYKNKRFREAIAGDEDLARDVLGKRRIEIREGRFFPEKMKEPEPITFHAFCREYRQYAKANKKASTCGREVVMMRMFDAVFKDKNLHEITSWDLETWKSKRKAGARSRKKKPLAVASVNRELSLIKNMFSMAVKWKRLKESPAKDVKILKGAAKRTRYLMPDEVELLLSKCKDWLRPFVKLAVHTGMRRGELLGLRWSQVNLEEGIVSLFDTKNRESRYIPLDETAKEVLRGIQASEGLVFPNRNGNPIEGAFLTRTFREAVDAAGITDFKPHDLRHTFASNLVMAGVDLYTVGELLGHKDVKMTKRYAHLAPAYKAKAINILDQVFSRSQKAPQPEKVVSLRG